MFSFLLEKLFKPKNERDILLKELKKHTVEGVVISKKAVIDNLERHGFIVSDYRYFLIISIDDKKMNKNVRLLQMDYETLVDNYIYIKQIVPCSSLIVPVIRRKYGRYKKYVCKYKYAEKYYNQEEYRKGELIYETKRCKTNSN